MPLRAMRRMRVYGYTHLYLYIKKYDQKIHTSIRNNALSSYICSYITSLAVSVLKCTPRAWLHLATLARHPLRRTNNVQNNRN